MTDCPRIGAVILAAGQSSRYRAADPSAISKVVATLEGKPLVRHVAEAALAAGLAPVIVVTGFADQATRAALEGLPVMFVHNPLFATGLSSSLKEGVALLPDDVSGAAILLADMPRVSAALLLTLVKAFEDHPGACALAPNLNGQRGNPVFIRRALFGDVSQLEGDVGARALLRGRSDVVDVMMDDGAVAFDVDTPDALSAPSV